MRRQARLTAASLLALAIAGCTLPRGAAIQGEVLRATDAENPGFAVYAVNRALLPQVAAWPAPDAAAQRKWPRHSTGEPGQIVAPGDTVEITIWDSDANSLLAAPESKAVQLQTMQVTPAGTVFLPYVGQIPIAGMAPDRARETVQDRLSTLIPSAQVQISVRPGPKNSVALVGGIRQPGTYPLVTRDMTVLGLISQGGGVSEALENPQARLVRGTDYFAISIERLYAEPDLDATLQPGDKLFVEEDRRYFLSLGATGSERQIAFNREEMTALDALSMAGGISDQRADPKGILILREYPAAAVVSPSAPAAGPADSRVIFAVDLTSADGLFSAGRFRIMPRDLVLATESPVTSARTILGLFGTTLGIVNTLEN